MFSNKYESLLPENTYKEHLSILNRSLLHQYKVSTQSSMNISSQILLKNVWQTNKDLGDKNNEDILKRVKNITKGMETNNSMTWKSCLGKIEDPISLFEKNLSKCLRCAQSHPGLTGAEQLLKNKCSCNINISEAAENFEKENFTDNKTQFVVTSLNSNNFTDEANSSDDNKHLYKPKFGRPKLPRPSNQLSSSKNTPIYPDVDLEKEDEMKAHKSNVSKLLFKTAKEQLLASNPAAKRTLGTSRKAQAKFVSPMIGAQDKPDVTEPEVTDERLKHIDPKMIELIESEIIDKGTPISWDDIAGLKMAKSVIQEAVVWPMLRPDIFTGLRRPPKGILLFGPPGTGKTLIGKCVAAQCNATFFSISASSLTSKWIGDGEKMVRALFAVATCHQPAVIFIDEIDSLLTQRSDSEHEATRRIKTEFLVQFDGASTTEEDRVLIVGATNRPQELDEAARRRLVKRLYIPLPDEEARTQIISNLLRSENSTVSLSEAAEVSRLTAGYSGADVRALCAEAAMGPVRALPLQEMTSIPRDKVRPVNIQDFKNALQRVKPSVSQDDLGQYEKWNNTYGQGF